MAGPLALVGQLFVGGVWTTYKGLEGAGWQVTVGPDVETGTRPNKIEFQFDNDSRQMDPYNVAGALYGQIGRNTRMRLMINSIPLTYAEASVWAPDETPEFVSGSRGLAWTDITAEGLLRRIGRWTDPLASPMARQIGSYSSLIGYWRLEDPVGATRLAQEVSRAAAGKFSGTVTLQGDPGAGGSDQSLTIGSDGVITGTFPTQSGNGYQLCWAAKLPALPSSSTMQPIMTWTDTAARTWVWQVNNTQMGFTCTDADGTLLTNLASAYGTQTPNQWIRYRMKISVSGSTLTYEPAWYAQDAISIVGVTNTFSSTVAGRPKTCTASGNAWTTGASYSHVFAVSSTSLDLTTGDTAKAFNGYLNEPAGLRFLRLMSEQNLTAYALGDSVKTVLMGRQKPGILSDLLTECAVTDGALIYDEPLDIAITFRTRLDMTDRTPTLALTKNIDVATPLRRLTDDVGVINSVTVTNADGTRATSELATGALSVLPPPAGIGRYKGTVDVNMGDVNAVDDRADFELNKATIDRPRYEQVTVDLLKNPSYSTTVSNMRPGDWISITGAEPDPVMLRVIGWKRSGDAVRDKVTFNCLPADIFQVAIFDTTGYLAGSASTTLAAGATNVATTLLLTTLNPKDVFSTVGGYDLKIAGERIGVPLGGMSVAAGTGPFTQTITGAVRSKNGIVKAQLSTAVVDVADPVRFGL